MQGTDVDVVVEVVVVVPLVLVVLVTLVEVVELLLLLVLVDVVCALAGTAARTAHQISAATTRMRNVRLDSRLLVNRPGAARRNCRVRPAVLERLRRGLHPRWRSADQPLETRQPGLAALVVSEPLRRRDLVRF